MNNANPQRQRGVAIITALLVVVLAASIATYLLAQQSHALTRTERATARAQAGLYAAPTMDFARALLSEALKNTGYISNQQAWAQGISYPLDNAIASGIVKDETAKFNLNNLVQPDQKPSPLDVAVFKRLLAKLKLDPALADALIDWIDSDNETSPAGAEDGYYMGLPNPYRAANQPLVQWQELARVRGFDSATLERLAPFATALPGGHTTINLNTASIELLAALMPELNDSEITNVVRMRDALPFDSLAKLKDRSELAKLKPDTLTALGTLANIDSKFFTVTMAITSESSQVRQTALLQRESPPAWPRIIWVQTQ